MSRSWEKFRALSTQEKLLLATAFAALPVASLGLRILGWRRLKSILKQRGDRQRQQGQGYPYQAARLSNIAGGSHGLRMTCLERSVALWWLLNIQGYDSHVVIGVRKGADALQAHGWVEYEGMPLNDRPEVRHEFLALTSL